MNAGKIFVLSAPAGTGKTTLVNLLTQEFPHIVRSISCTTRAPRGNEREGRDYFFLTEKEFESKKLAGEFLEYACVFGNQYGTSKESVLAEQQLGRHVFLVIDTQGSLQLQRKELDATYIFISPPSLEELANRLDKRQADSEDVIRHRLQSAQEELSCIGRYDYHIINDHLESAYAVLRSIVIAEEHRITKRTS